MQLISEKLEDIKKLCSEYKVKFLFVFGSTAKNKETTDSDIDLLIDIEATDPYEYTDNYIGFKAGLQTLLGKKIDLLESRALTNKFLKEEIEKTKVAIYG